MDLILHIGHAKTGSSSIQAALRSMQASLLEHGIAYRPSRGGGNNNDFTYLAGVELQRIKSEESHEQLREGAVKAAQALRTLAESNRSQYILLTGEAFFTLTKPQIKCMVRNMGISVNRIYGICYFRDPVGLYLSIIQQRVKGSQSIPDPTTYKRDFLHAANTWRAFLSRRQFIVRRFHPQGLHGESVVDDFMHILSSITGRPLRCDGTRNVNVSLSAEGMVLMQEYRRDFLSEFENQFHPKSRALTEFLRTVAERNVLPLTKPSAREIYSRILIHNHKEILSKFKRRYGIDFGIDLKGDISKSDLRAYATNQIRDIVTFNEASCEILKHYIPDYGADGGAGSPPAGLDSGIHDALSSLADECFKNVC